MDIETNLINCKRTRTHELESFTTVLVLTVIAIVANGSIVAARVLTDVLGIKHFTNISMLIMSCHRPDDRARSDLLIRPLRRRRYQDSLTEFTSDSTAMTSSLSTSVLARRLLAT